MSDALSLVIRADASSSIGSGHVMRCLTLAGRLRGEGVRVLFVCRAHDGNLIDLIPHRGFAVEPLPAPGEASGLTGYAAWLGVSQEVDARDTAEAIARHGWDRAAWLVVDHYALDNRWETALRTVATRILAIDDLADRRHDCDVLVDQNLVAGMERRYDGLVPDHATRLLGPRYALLQPDYARLAASRSGRQGPVRRILIFIGGADRGITLRALQGFLSLDRADIACDVVISASSPDRQQIEHLAATRSNIGVHHSLPSLAPLMADADLAIGAGGATSWERLCLGLRSIVVILAENQRPIAEELSRRGLAVLLGDADAVTPEDFSDALAAELARPADSGTNRGLVDGRGTDRVAAVMLAGRGMAVSLRPVEATDEALVLEFANDPATRANSFNPAPIRVEDHAKWFAARLAQPDRCRMFVAQTGTIPVGLIRFELREHGWVIAYGVAPEFRGRGLATALLKRGAEELRRHHPDARLVGDVLPGNAASHRAFLTLGYAPRVGDDGSTRYEQGP